MPCINPPFAAANNSSKHSITMYAPWAVMPTPVPALPNLAYPAPVYPQPVPYPVAAYLAPQQSSNREWRNGWKDGWRAAQQCPPTPPFPAFPFPPSSMSSPPVFTSSHNRILKRDAWRYFSGLTPPQKRDALNWATEQFLPYITSAQQDEWFSGRSSEHHGGHHDYGCACGCNGSVNDGWDTAGPGWDAGGAWF